MAASKISFAILGTGGVGESLARAFLRQGHSVVFGTRDSTSAKTKELLSRLSGATAAEHAEAVKASSVIVVALPWDAVEPVLKSIASITNGKVVIDATNPIAAGLTIAIPRETSAGLLVQSWLPNAKVVKAFNTIGHIHYNNPSFERKPDMYIAGNDSGAKSLVSDIVTKMDFTPVDVGDLAQSNWTESLAMLWITMAFKFGYGTNMAFSLVHGTQRPQH